MRLLESVRSRSGLFLEAQDDCQRRGWRSAAPRRDAPRLCGTRGVRPASELSDLTENVRNSGVRRGAQVTPVNSLKLSDVRGVRDPPVGNKNALDDSTPAACEREVLAVAGGRSANRSSTVLERRIRSIG